MQFILFDLVAEVSKYLSPQDIASCCAVSVHWREVFGSNEVWKRLCDPEIEEHLRTTPCVVEPVFQLPQQRGSSLAPISQWRTAFLREQHLWRNWRTGNTKTVEHDLETVRSSLEQFITNDMIVRFSIDALGLWDLKADPPVCKASLIFCGEMYYNPTVYEDGIVVLKSDYGDFIHILKVDTIEGSITLKWQFQFDDKDCAPRLLCGNNPLVNNPSCFGSFDVLITPEKKCIGYFEFQKCSDSFFVWDLESGIQLKKESLPSNVPNCGLSIVGCKSGSKTCEDVLVLTPDSVSYVLDSFKIIPLITLKCQVYNVNQVNFLPFTQKFSTYTNLVSNPFETCAITDNYLALSDWGFKECSINIHNYQTGHKIRKLQKEMYSPVKVI